MFLGLLLFLNGIAAQQQQTETTNQKLDKLLAGQELQQTTEFASRLANSDLSWNKDIISKIAEKIAESEQTLVAGLESIVLEVQSVELIIQAAYGFNKTLNQLVEENKTLRNRQAAAAAISVCQLLVVII